MLIVVASPMVEAEVAALATGRLANGRIAARDVARVCPLAAAVVASAVGDELVGHVSSYRDIGGANGQQSDTTVAGE